MSFGVLLCGDVVLSDVLLRRPQDTLLSLALATRCQSLTGVAHTSSACLFQRGYDYTQVKKKTSKKKKLRFLPFTCADADL